MESLQKDWASGIGRVSARVGRVGWGSNIGSSGQRGGQRSGNRSSHGVIHHMFIVWEGIWGNVGRWQDSGAGDSEESEDGGELVGDKRKKDEWLIHWSNAPINVLNPYNFAEHCWLIWLLIVERISLNWWFLRRFCINLYEMDLQKNGALHTN